MLRRTIKNPVRRTCVPGAIHPVVPSGYAGLLLGALLCRCVRSRTPERVQSPVIFKGVLPVLAVGPDHLTIAASTRETERRFEARLTLR